ncbi:hypothetical protein [Microcoleus sp.]|uniref:hypothetical protein n=1 Tax=Microcoleus sp. TaxID=44472 RepID=UPI003593284C
MYVGAIARAIVPIVSRRSGQKRVFGANHGFSGVELVKSPVFLVCAIALLGLMGDRAL